MSVPKKTTHAIVASLILGLLAAPGWAGERAAPCTDWPLLTAGNGWRAENRLPGRADRLLLQVSEPGVVALASAAPGREPLAPELLLDPVPCGSEQAGGSAVIAERAASAMLVLIRTPGSYRLRVMPRDPLLALGPYRIESRFAADSEALAPGLELHSVYAADGAGGDPREEEEDEDIEEVEGDPMNLTVPGPTGSEGGATHRVFAADGAGTGGPREEEEDEDIEEVEGDPMNLTTPGPGVLMSAGAAVADPPRLWSVSGGRVSLRLAAGEELSELRFFPLCRTEATDDHGDLPQCATALEPGAMVSGSLDDAFGDDHDYFTFRLDASTRMRIESQGDSDTFGGLYDVSGRRLAVDDDGGSGRNFLLETRLEPGRYFVRVEGADGAEGAYRLTLRSSDR